MPDTEIKKVHRTAREQRQILWDREERLYQVQWAEGQTYQRRDAISKARRRIWGQLRTIDPQCIREEQDELWPNGLPSHP